MIGLDTRFAKMCCYSVAKAAEFTGSRRKLAEMPNSGDNQQKTNPPASGPSWSLMLFIILLAMLAAAGIAWAFINPMLHPHHPH